MRTDVIQHNKLVRDRIPLVLETMGLRCSTSTLTSSEERISALKTKLVEEAQETLDAGDDHLIEELADVLQVIHDLARELGIDQSTIEQTRAHKLTERGGFTQGTVLIEVWKEE